MLHDNKLSESHLWLIVYWISDCWRNPIKE